MADLPGKGSQLLATRPKLASLEKLPISNREQIQRRIEAAIDAEAEDIIGTVPRFGIAMESPSLSLPFIQPSMEGQSPIIGKDGKEISVHPSAHVRIPKYGAIRVKVGSNFKLIWLLLLRTTRQA
jgi:hypothetical protein